MNQSVRNGGDPRKYYATIPHMADDDLDPYQYRLYGHYIRVCGQDDGECWESVKTTAKICKMSAGMVTKTRNSLEEMGFIQVERDETDNGTCHITIVDRWSENMERYSKRSCGERGVHTVNASVHVVKQRITQEEKPKKKQIVTGTTPVTQTPTPTHSQPSLLEETVPLAIPNGTVENKEKPKREPTPLYRTYERLAELQFGINKAQTLKEVKRLLEIGATPDEIVELGEYLLAHDPWIAEHGLNASLLVKRWQGWVKQGKPTVKGRDVVEFKMGRSNEDVIDFSFTERRHVPSKR